MSPEIGRRRIHLDSVESTNNYVAECADTGTMAEGAVIMAHEQTAGRGQRGNAWQMEPGLDLAMSVLLRPSSIRMDNAFRLNKAVALAIRAAIAEKVGGGVKVKWPNDILIHGLKVAGILIEMSWQGENCQRAICGIGVNVASKRKGVTDGAVSIVDAGEKVTIEGMCDSICLALNRYLRLALDEGSVEIDRAYRSHLAWRGVEQSYLVGGQERRMTVVDVDEAGRLVVDEAGLSMAFAHGSISRLPIQPL